MVLLDLGDRECGAVELEAGHASGDSAEEGVGERFQLHAECTGFPGIAGEVLRGLTICIHGVLAFWILDIG